MSNSEIRDILSNAKRIASHAMASGLIKRNFSNTGTYKPAKTKRVFSPEHKRKLSAIRAIQEKNKRSQKTLAAGGRAS